MWRVVGQVVGVAALWVSLAAPSQARELLHMVSRGDHNARYTETMIRLALDKAGYAYTLNIHPGDLTAARQQRDTREGRIDIMWSATSRELEETLLPVRIPLYKGLIGHRIFITHPDNIERLNTVETLDQLRAFSYGQGVDWPDARILKDNGFDVREESFDRLITMVHAKRFEIFPRGVHEPWSEVSNRPGLELSIDARIMLVYPMPFYLFVTPEHPELAQALERGLMRAIEDGSFDRLFRSSPMVQAVINRAGVGQRKVFFLENRALSDQTPLEDPRLWVSLEELAPSS
ncbi:diguanylate cyclase [Marinimicrobium sp. C6131]|uniref:diguanylate cyclase n=1 Tax=Marinimicrobium sp. C6131 TaxID=3022676 RepID=UPI00223D7369|nr:diguanylate cyclase [Marinimicrobium sp. C6131]UZJ44720.1 diguanylate cyclase [Marinimicrobium sp. C6131]